MAYVALLGAIAATAAETGFTPLFNGRELTGWKSDDPCWSVEGGILRGSIATGNPKRFRGFLELAAGEVGNFNSVVEFKDIRLKKL